MSEHISLPPEHDHVEAWLATIQEVNPTGAYELVQLQAEKQAPDSAWTDEKQARLADLGLARKAVQNLVTEYLPATERYGRNTKGDPSPFEYDDRLQAAREGLVLAAWQYRPGRVNDQGVPMTFLDYAKQRMEAVVDAWKHTAEGRFFETSAPMAKRAENDARRKSVTVARKREVTRYVAVRNETLAFEELESTDMVTPNDPTFEASARADVRRLYQITSAAWSVEQRKVVAMYWGLLGDAPYKSFSKLGADAGISEDLARTYVKMARSDFRYHDVMTRFAGHVFDDVGATQQYAHAHGNPAQQASTANATSSHSRKSRTGEKPPKHNEAFEETLANLTQALGQPGYFAKRHYEKRDVYQATEAILEACPGVTSAHIEAMWNRGVESLVEGMHRKLGRNFELWRVGLLFSRLLNATMINSSIVRLTIPPSLMGKMDFIGAELGHGTLFVAGDVGLCAGINTGPDATVRIEGRAGTRLGVGAAGVVTALYSPEQGRQRF